jgi:hypothetical protein
MRITALRLKKELVQQYKQAGRNHDAARLDRFVASKTWLRRVIDRANWRSKRLHGAAGKVDTEACAAEMAELRSVVAKYEPSCVFNMDETGLYYRSLPQRSYIGPDEDPRAVRGVGVNKTRITLALCSNGTGSVKVKPFIIGSAARPFASAGARCRTCTSMSRRRARG